MKKFLLTAALIIASTGVFAHPSSRVHFHNNDEGTITYASTLAPTVDNTYERDANGRRVRVETTTRCVDIRVNPRNNHLRCLDEDTSVRRFFDDTYYQQGPRAVVDPVVYRAVERDNQGRRIIVTTTYTCSDARWSPDRRQALCFYWEANVEREYVRRDRDGRGNRFDLNGDGRVDGWERLVYEGFREILEDRD